MQEDVIIREYQRGDEKQIVALLENVFQGWPHYEINCSKREYWDWKYRENPIKKEQIIVAKKDDKVVGCFHRIPVKAKIGSEVYYTSAGTDVAVHPDYRRQGIYNQMLDNTYNVAKKHGMAFQWGITRNPILVSKGLREKYGSLPYSCNIYTKIKNLGVHINNTGTIPITERLGFTAIKTLNKLRYLFKHEEPPNSKIKIEEIEEYDSTIDTFWEKIQEEYTFVFERKRDYMNWRYCRPDIVKYRNIIATENGETRGYAVIKIDEKDPNYKKGYIVDLLTCKSSKTIHGLLMKNLIKYMGKEKVNFVCGLNTHLHEKTWDRYGFLNSRREVYFQYTKDYLYIGDDEKRLHLCKPEEIHFCYGDGDWI